MVVAKSGIDLYIFPETACTDESAMFAEILFHRKDAESAEEKIIRESLRPLRLCGWFFSCILNKALS